MREEITVFLDGHRTKALKGQTLSEIAGGERPCGGKGRCGKCKLWAQGELSPVTEEERQHLSPEELASGARLGCMARALGDCEIRTETAGTMRILLEGRMPEGGRNPRFSSYGVAVDLGTTTLAARLYGADGRLLAEEAEKNPQSVYGADVVSRIEAALGGKGRDLAVSVRGAVNRMIASLASKAGIEPRGISGAVVTGNTVMLSLLTETEVEPFSHAPFRTARLFGETLTAGELGLSCLEAEAPVYLPPCISAFVGADTVCALLATELCEGKSALLADIGTNGEMALWHEGRLTVCSTAAGPAFEGVGISQGMRGETGAVDRVFILNGKIHAHAIGEGAPQGICGSGLVDAAAAMLDLELLDESGYLEEACLIAGNVFVTPEDVRALQLAKSAIAAGLLTLLHEAGLGSGERLPLFIAGGFGAYLNMRNAERIGLLPRGLARGATAVGNAALAGASVLLLDREAEERAALLARRAQVVELATHPTFAEKFMEAMAFTEI